MPSAMVTSGSPPAAGNNPPPPPAGGVGTKVFRASTFESVLYGQIPQSVTLGTGALIRAPVPVFGYMQSIDLLVTCTTAGNAAAVAFQPDGPFSCIQSLLVKDGGGTALYQMPGYSLYQAQKNGAFYNGSDPVLNTRVFSTTPGVGGGVGGSFSFILSLPFEIMRQGAGCIPNNASNFQFVVEIVTASAASQVYSVSPTNPGTLTVQPILRAYAVPTIGDGATSAPLAPGTVSYWSSTLSQYTGAANGLVLNLPNPGYWIRNWALITRNAAGQRANGLLSGTIRLAINQQTWFEATEAYLSESYYRLFNRVMDTGVIWWAGTAEPDGLPLKDFPFAYIPTNPSTNFQVYFNTSAPCSVEFVTNFVKPGSGFEQLLQAGG